MKTLKINNHFRICYLDQKECKKFRDNEGIVLGVMIQYRKHWWNRWKYYTDSFNYLTKMYTCSPYKQAYYFAIENYLLNTIHEHEAHKLENEYNTWKIKLNEFMEKNMNNLYPKNLKETTVFK